MAKNITSIKDLVIQVMTNGKEIEAKAKKGDSESCFQMGMSHLLGINSAIDFKKAAQYFGDKSLADDQDANRLLGFIAECEGKFGVALQYYAKVGKSTRSYLQKVYEERGNLQSYLKKLNLPDTFLNKEITAILYDYIKGGSPILPKIKIAYICEDEQTLLEEIQALVDNGDLCSAKKWLQIGNVAVENSLYATIEKKSIELMIGSNMPEKFDVIDIEGSSLTFEIEKDSSSEKIKPACDDTAKMCIQGWCEKVSQITNSYKKAWEQEEEKRRKKEDEERKRREEEERIRKEKEEAKRIWEEQRRKEEERLAKGKEMMYGWDIFITLVYVVFLVYCYFKGDFSVLMGALLCTGCPVLGLWYFIRVLIKDHYKISKKK